MIILLRLIRWSIRRFNVSYFHWLIVRDVINYWVSFVYVDFYHLTYFVYYFKFEISEFELINNSRRDFCWCSMIKWNILKNLDWCCAFWRAWNRTWRSAGRLIDSHTGFFLRHGEIVEERLLGIIIYLKLNWTTSLIFQNCFYL